MTNEKKDLVGDTGAVAFGAIAHAFLDQVTVRHGDVSMTTTVRCGETPREAMRRAQKECKEFMARNAVVGGRKKKQTDVEPAFGMSDGEAREAERVRAMEGE